LRFGEREGNERLAEATAMYKDMKNSAAKYNG